MVLTLPITPCLLNLTYLILPTIPNFQCFSAHVTQMEKIQPEIRQMRLRVSQMERENEDSSRCLDDANRGALLT